MKFSLPLYSRILLPLALLGACRSSRDTAQSPDPSSASWQQHPLTIDGSNKDWTGPLPFTIKAENLSYSVTNDGQNLYILLSTKSQQEQQKIIQGGMTIWVNTKGGQNVGDAIGIGYPLDERNDRDRQLMAEARPDRYRNDRPVTLEDKKDYALYGFKKDSIGNYTYGDENPQGIAMRMDYSEGGELVYEAAIPLQTLYPEHNPSSSYAAKSISVGIYIQALPPNANVPRGNGGGGGPAIGVGGGLGFGSFGSGGGLGLSIGTGSLIGGGGGRGKQQLFRDTQIWQTVQLARH